MGKYFRKRIRIPQSHIRSTIVSLRGFQTQGIFRERRALNLSNENKVLLYCSQTTIPEDRAAHLNDLLSRPLNWEFIADAAFSQNIAQLLYKNVKGLPDSHLIPSRVMEKLKKGYHRNTARNMYLYGELRNIADAFRNAGLEVVALKGVALAGMVYRDVGLRPMMDIDLLVRKDDIELAQRIMADLHYTMAVKYKSEQWFREKHFHLPPYRHREKPVVVEIHWHVTENVSDVDMQKWWERAENKNLMGCRIKVLSPEDMLVHLCIHLYDHGYANAFVLRGLCDIYETLRHFEAEIDWELLRSQTKKQGIEKKVHSMLYLVQSFYDQSGRSPGMIKLQGVDHHLLGMLVKSLFAEDAKGRMNSYLLKSMFYDGFLKKARYLLPKIFPSRKEMSMRYPISHLSRMMLFYYLLHPFHLMAKYGRFFIELYRTKPGSTK